MDQSVFEKIVMQYNMKFNTINKVSLTKINDQELLLAHLRQHEAFINALKQHNTGLKKEVERLHPLIVHEMISRGINHGFSDDLDNFLPV